jgi:hypothetical protein
MAPVSGASTAWSAEAMHHSSAEKASDWWQGRITTGHGVASGRSAHSPYPAGTIAMQRPIFQSLGLDLSDCWPGTLNLSFAPLELQLRDPDHCFTAVTWTDRHPPETFSFWRVELRSAGAVQMGWIYYPHPETKQRHWQPATTVELLSAWIPGLKPGAALELRDPRARLRLLDGVRLRARLLEFLKFRVLAAQASFFINDTPAARRQWLQALHPEALALADADLERVWQQAKQLYGVP